MRFLFFLFFWWWFVCFLHVSCYKKAMLGRLSHHAANGRELTTVAFLESMHWFDGSCSPSKGNYSFLVFSQLFLPVHTYPIHDKFDGARVYLLLLVVYKDEQFIHSASCYDRLVCCVFCFNFVRFAGQMAGATTASPGIFPNMFPSTPGQVYSFF